MEKNQDKPLEEITRTPEADHTVESTSLASAEEARSLVCNECGKSFRSKEQAEFHATKSGHVDFAESTAEIAPLTEAEKKAKLEELRQKLEQKRSGASDQDKLDHKKNEVGTRYAQFIIWVIGHDKLLTENLGNSTQKHQGDPRSEGGSSEERAA